MPMDGITLGFIARELSEKLIGGRVDKVTQPEKDELNLLIRSQGANHLLLLSASANNARVHLTQSKKNNPMEPPMFCMLLRKHLQGGRVTDVRQVGSDRILEMDIEGLDELGDRAVRTLVCELMGRHSNLILISAEGRIIDSIRHVSYEVSRVREVLPGLTYERPPVQDKLPYRQVTVQALATRMDGTSGLLHKALSGAISGLAAQTAQELSLRVSGAEDARLDPEGVQPIAEAVTRFLAGLDTYGPPQLILDEAGAPVDVTAFPYLRYAGRTRKDLPSLSEALDQFFRTRDQRDRIQQKSASLYRVLRNNIERCEKKLGLQMLALEDSDRMEEYRIKGELLTAGMNHVKKGQTECYLTNYYDPECAPMKIELNVKLSPGQNAQRYFKLYQKARSAQVLAAQQKRQTTEELNYLEGQMDNLGNCVEEAELNEIREELEREGYVRANHNRRQIKKLPPSQPLHFLSSEGIDILIGKNNLQNDKLTFSAQPNEWWLHAKDMPGSHVIVVSTEPGEQTLLEAAVLGARHSHGRTSSKVPMDYTQRKYVKKPSGSKPGFVIYTHQRTLFVSPEDPAALRVKQIT